MLVGSGSTSITSDLQWVQKQQEKQQDGQWPPQLPLQPMHPAPLPPLELVTPDSWNSLPLPELKEMVAAATEAEHILRQDLRTLYKSLGEIEDETSEKIKEFIDYTDHHGKRVAEKKLAMINIREVQETFRYYIEIWKYIRLQKLESIRDKLQFDTIGTRALLERVKLQIADIEPTIQRIIQKESKGKTGLKQKEPEKRSALDEMYRLELEDEEEREATEKKVDESHIQDSHERHQRLNWQNKLETRIRRLAPVAVEAVLQDEVDKTKQLNNRLQWRLRDAALHTQAAIKEHDEADLRRIKLLTQLHTRAEAGPHCRRTVTG